MLISGNTQAGLADLLPDLQKARQELDVAAEALQVHVDNMSVQLQRSLQLSKLLERTLKEVKNVIPPAKE